MTISLVSLLKSQLRDNLKGIHFIRRLVKYPVKGFSGINSMFDKLYFLGHFDLS